MADSDQPSAAPAAAAATTNLGELLRSARLAQGLTIEQIATELRIEAQYLNALEENNFAGIGIPVFVKGYLRQYGQRLGVDIAQLHALYSKQAKLEDVQIQPSPTIHLRDERQITVWIVVAIVLAALIGAVAMWWTSGGSFDFISTVVAPNPATPAVAAPAPVLSAPAPAAVLAPIPAVIPSEAPAPADETVAPAEGGGDDEGAAEGSNGPALPDAPAPAAAPAAEAAAGSTPAALELVFAQESWAEVIDARGRRLFYGLGAASQRAPLRGDRPFAVVLGNVAGTQLLVDGQAYVAPTDAVEGNVARFTIDAQE